jgi:hypothetical protein
VHLHITYSATSIINGGIFLENNYNSVTQRVLARAIIRLSTLDLKFATTQGDTARGCTCMDYTVACLGAVPNQHCARWRRLRRPMPSTPRRASMAQQHVSPTSSGEAQAQYMILSVKHIILCGSTSPNSFEHTAPEPLFNGEYVTEPLSNLALNLSHLGHRLRQTFDSYSRCRQNCLLAWLRVPFLVER